MFRALADFIVRAGVWVAAIAIWIQLNRPAQGLYRIHDGAPGVIGYVLIAIGAALYIPSAWALATVIRDARGRPQALLVRGPYRYVRNPLYLAAAVVVVGVSILCGAWRWPDLFKMAIAAGLAHFAVVLLEEPATRRRVGPAYDEYRQRVPRWFPRWRQPRDAKQPHKRV